MRVMLMSVCDLMAQQLVTIKVDGPYYVKNFVVYGGGRSLSIKDALTT